MTDFQKNIFKMPVNLSDFCKFFPSFHQSRLFFAGIVMGRCSICRKSEIPDNCRKSVDLAEKKQNP